MNNGSHNQSIDYTELSYTDLQRVAKSLGLKAIGSKTSILQRITDNNHQNQDQSKSTAKKVSFSSYFEDIPNSSDDSDYEPSLNSTDMEREELEAEAELELEEEDEGEEIIDLSAGGEAILELLKTQVLASLLGGQQGEDDVDDDDDDDDGGENGSLTKKHRVELVEIKRLLRDETPTISSMMKLDIPIRVKKDLFEKIKVLGGIPKYTDEFIASKNVINRIIKEYTGSSLKSRQFTAYDKQEDELRGQRQFCVPLKYRILSSNQPTEVKSILYEKFHTLNQLAHGDSNYGKMSEWIEWVLKLPTDGTNMNLNTKRDRINMIKGVQKHLDDKLYGMKNVKEDILCCVNDFVTKRGDSNQSIALAGSPGIGKTSIIRTLADCLGIPFYQVSLGGAKDSSFLTGHGYTYEGAKPGVIVEALTRMKSNNGIIFFDEFDKIADTAGGMELVNALLHVTDPTQNMDFRDQYMPEVKIDLSNIWFMYSMNNVKHINSILRDRIPVLQVPDYTHNDKIQIVKQFIFPKTLKQYGYGESDIVLDEGSIEHLIKKARKERGVRDLTRTMGIIIKRLHFLKSCSTSDGLGSLSVSFDINQKKKKKKKRLSRQIVINKDLMDLLMKDPVPANLSFTNMYL
jgi:hypothetical protein